MAYLHGGKHTLNKIIGIINDKYWLVTQSVTNVPQTNNTSTSGMNEE
jgi:hypothetical protein